MTAPYAPTFITPSGSGQLCNFHGSNQGSDGIFLTVRYSNPKGASQQVSLIRIQVNKVASKGIPITSTVAWDSGYMGDVPACQNLPDSKLASGGNSSVTYLGRFYFMPSDGAIVSAPVSSGAVGTWRYETPLPTQFGLTPTVYSLAIVSNFLYCTAKIGAAVPASMLYVTTINPDGTINPWVAATVPSGSGASDTTWKQTGLLGYWDGVSTTAYLLSWNTTLNSAAIQTYTVSLADGSISAATNSTHIPTVVRDNLAFGCIGVNNAGTGLNLVLIGGTASAASSVVDKGSFTGTTGAVGSFAAGAALPAARSGGIGIILQNGTVFYIAGASTSSFANVTNTVYENTFQRIDAGSGWTTSATTLPTSIMLGGGAVALSDYDVGNVLRTADQDTQSISTSPAISGHGITLASFKPSGTPALVGVAGTLAQGTNTAVSPTFGQATVATHLLIALVSGSDQTGSGGATNLGSTGGATFSYDFSGVNSDNVILTNTTYTVPVGGIYVNSISCYMGGYTGSVSAQFCVWNNANGALLASSGITASKGLSLKTAGGLNTFIAGSTVIRIGFWRDKSKDAMWGVQGSGTFKFMTNQGSVPNIGANAGSASACSGPYVCGQIQAYLTYSTLAQADITLGTASGWSKATQISFDNEQLQIWYKPNCGNAETAPTFASTDGSSPLHAQLLEFSGVATSNPLDQSGVKGFGGNASTSQIVTAGAADGQAGNLIVAVGRWELASAAVATLTDIFNNATAVAVGTTGASSINRHTSTAYGVVPVGAAASVFPYVVVVGGENAAGAPTSNADSAPVIPGSPSDLRAFITTSQGGNAQANEFGTSAALILNQDGTQDITIPYGASGIGNGLAVGMLAIQQLDDGDQISIVVTFVGSDGDPSPANATVIKIGQPPSISGVQPTGSTASCQPIVTFTYVPGAGGGVEARYEVQIVNNLSVIVADSGVVNGQQNQFAPTLNPLLGIGLAASTIIQVWSLDTPMSGSTNMSSTTTGFTPSQAAASSPTSTNLTVDNVGGTVTAIWTNPLASTVSFNRLYWRLSGTTAWNIAKDNITPLINTPQNYTLMDSIPLGVAIDVAVSAIVLNNPGTSETGLVVCGTNKTILPDYHWDIGGYTAMLHIAGQGATYSVPVPNVPPIKFPRHIDSEVVVMFGNTAPTIRYGVFNYREIEINVIPLTSQLPALDALLAQAQQGNVIVYRDTLGNIIYCGLPPDRDREADLYYKDTLKLVEQQFTFTP